MKGYHEDPHRPLLILHTFLGAYIAHARNEKPSRIQVMERPVRYTGRDHMSGFDSQTGNAE